jgi:hypothetical protein
MTLGGKYATTKYSKAKERKVQIAELVTSYLIALHANVNSVGNFQFNVIICCSAYYFNQSQSTHQMNDQLNANVKCVLLLHYVAKIQDTGIHAVHIYFDCLTLIHFVIFIVIHFDQGDDEDHVHEVLRRFGTSQNQECIHSGLQSRSNIQRCA